MKQDITYKDIAKGFIRYYKDKLTSARAELAHLRWLNVQIRRREGQVTNLGLMSSIESNIEHYEERIAHYNCLLYPITVFGYNHRYNPSKETITLTFNPNTVHYGDVCAVLEKYHCFFVRVVQEDTPTFLPNTQIKILYNKELEAYETYMNNLHDAIEELTK